MWKKTTPILVGFFIMANSNVSVSSAERFDGDRTSHAVDFVVKPQGFDRAGVRKVKGKVVLFDSDDVNGGQASDLKLRNGELTARIDLPDTQDPLNIQTAFLLFDDHNTEYRCFSEVNLTFPSSLKKAVLNAACEISTNPL